MSDLDDTLKAFASFRQGLTDLRMRRTLDSANEEVNQIRMNEVNEAKKMAAIRQVANNLAVNMAQIGATPQEAAAYGQLISPKPPPIQNALEGMLSDDPTVRDRTQEYMRTQNQLAKDLAGIKAGASTGTKTNNAILGQKKAFQSSIKKQIDALDSANSIFDLASQSDSIAANVIYKKGLIKASGDDRISDADYGQLNLAGSALNQFKEFVSKIYSGKVTQVSREEAMNIGKLLQAAARRRIYEKSFGFAASRAKQLPGISAYDLHQELLTENGLLDYKPGASPFENTSAAQPGAAPLSQPGSLKSLLVPRGGGRNQ